MKHILGVVMFCASLTMDHQRNSVEASPKADGATSHPQGKDATLQWFFRKLGKRGNVLDKCAPQSACALLQAPADASSFYVDEICYCGDGGKCSLEWDESGTDERSVNNADTQLKVNYGHCLSKKNLFPSDLCHLQFRKNTSSKFSFGKL